MLCISEEFQDYGDQAQPLQLEDMSEDEHEHVDDLDHELAAIIENTFDQGLVLSSPSVQPLINGFLRLFV